MSNHDDDIAAARKISKAMKPSRKWDGLQYQGVSEKTGAKVFYNSLYVVSLRRYEQGWAFGGGPWAQIGIHSADGSARHDWRDFQNIKNDLVGREWEAVELFPCESRLLDPSNYFLLYCAPSIPLGFNNGRIISFDEAIAPQRGWSVKPTDCDTQQIDVVIKEAKTYDKFAG